MRYELRKIAERPANMPAEIGKPAQLLSAQQVRVGTLFEGVLLGKVMCGAPLLFAHWKRDGEDTSGVFATSEVICTSKNLVVTGNGVFRLTNAHEEARRGRRRIDALVRPHQPKLLSVSFSWPKEDEIRTQLRAAMDDRLMLEVDDTPFAKATRFREFISTGVQQAIVEIGALHGLDDDGRVAKRHLHFLSDLLLRRYRSLSDVDLRSKLLVMANAALVSRRGTVLKREYFLSVLEPAMTRLVHFQADELPAAEGCSRAWPHFLARVEIARRKRDQSRP